MNRTEKQEVVAALAEQFRSANNLFLIDYRGMKVVDETELRRKVREIDGNYLVVKNTLALRAAESSGRESIGTYLEGPTAVAYHNRDMVALAKLLTEVGKTNPSFQFKAAYVEGKVIPPAEIQTIASMPSREVLLSRLVFLLQAPLQKLAAALKAPLRDLVLDLKQIEK